MHTSTPPNRLRQLREERDVSLVDVASACRVYPSTVMRWQDADIPRRHVATVAGLLKVSVPYLDGWSDDSSDPAPARAAA